MAVDPEVIAAVQASVDADPANVALRVHLAGLLVQAGRAADALVQAGAALQREPGHEAAMEVARRATADLAEAAAAPEELVEDIEEDEYDRFLRSLTDDDGLTIERSTLTLDDVGGLHDVKRRITTSFLAPMRNPELRAAYGTSLRGGLLMYGPPGCGKTHLARAVAGELGAVFLSVGLHELLEMYFGLTEKRIHLLFEAARRNAPCVLFIDEVDAIGHSRSNLRGSMSRNAVVQLLEELDGLRSDNDGVFVLGATNQVWDIDAALRRPGRFDRTLLVLPPDREAREAILRTHLAERPAAAVDVRRLARRTERYSGADLRLVCESAAQTVLERAIESGTPEPITTRDLEAAIEEVRPSTGRWFEMAANFATFANGTGDYDDLLAYMRKHRLG